MLSCYQCKIINNLCSCIVVAPVASVVVNRVGYRATTIVGSLMSASGLTISAFTSKVAMLYFSLGILAGRPCN